MFPRKNCLIAALVLLGCAPASGLGVRVADQDAFATARGNAFVATADSPAAIYYNPAGITQLAGQQLRVGVYAMTSNSTARTSGGREFSTKRQSDALPQLYYSISPRDFPLSFGVGLYAPFSLGLEWPDDTSFRSLSRKGSLTYLTISPVVAWKIHPTLSIGASPTWNHSRIELRRGIFKGGDEISFNGRDSTFGCTLGALWHPVAAHSFGFTYRCATIMNYQGSTDSVFVPPASFFSASTSERANARFDFPQQVIVGWAFHPTPQWNVEFNFDWTDWHTLDTVTLIRNKSSELALPYKWRASRMYELGATRYFERGWRASAGYVFSENSIPEGRFYPQVPDSDRHIASLGLGRKYERFGWDAGYQLALGHRNVVSSARSTTTPAESADGSYHFMGHALAISSEYRF